MTKLEENKIRYKAVKDSLENSFDSIYKIIDEGDLLENIVQNLKETTFLHIKRLEELHEKIIKEEMLLKIGNTLCK